MTDRKDEGMQIEVAATRDGMEVHPSAGIPLCRTSSNFGDRVACHGWEGVRRGAGRRIAEFVDPVTLA